MEVQRVKGFTELMRRRVLIQLFGRSREISKYRQIRSPSFVASAFQILSEAYEGHIPWLAWLAYKTHVNLVKSLVTFLGIALFTATDQIFPG